MLRPMPRRRRHGPAPDVFETFAHRVDEGDEAGDADLDRALQPGRLARSAGIGLGAMVLTFVAAVLGFWWGTAHEPDLQYTHLVWEGVIKLGWATMWAVLAGALALALSVVAVGLPWARRQRAREQRR
jgi:hypothetical protein